MTLEKWKYDLPESFTMCVVAARRSGKTTFLQFLTVKPDGFLDMGKVLCFTTLANSDAWSMLPKKDVIFGWRPRLVEKLLERQATRRQAKKYVRPLILIVDDLLSSSSKEIGYVSKYDPTLLKVFQTGRHYNVSLCLVSQSISLLGTTVTRNCDVFIWFRFHLKRDKDKVLELLGRYGDDASVAELLEKREQHKYFVLDLFSEGGDTLKDLVFEGRVPQDYVSYINELCGRPQTKRRGKRKYALTTHGPSPSP